MIPIGDGDWRHRRPNTAAAAAWMPGPRYPTPVVSVLGHPERVAGLVAHLPAGWTVRRCAELGEVAPDDLVVLSGATPDTVTGARSVLPRRTRVVALVDDGAPADTVAGVLTAGADVCVRGGQPAILAGHLVACRRRQTVEHWSQHPTLVDAVRQVRS